MGRVRSDDLAVSDHDLDVDTLLGAADDLCSPLRDSG